jgi:hypothetical protein
MLDIKENITENENIISELLNNQELEDELKNKIIAKQVNYIKDINSIDEFNIKEYLLKNNKIYISWKNVFGYYKETSEKAFDETLITFLNLEENYSILSEYLLETGEEDKSFIDEFSLEIIYAQELSLESYKALCKSISNRYDSLDINRIKTQNLTCLIDLNKMNMTVENIDALRVGHKPLSTRLIENSQGNFFSIFYELTLDDTDILMLLNSTVFTVKNKIELIESIDENIIIGNASLSNIVAELIIENRISLSSEAIEACFKSQISSITKFRIINNYFDKLSDAKVKEFVESLGEEYARIFIKQNKPVFSDTQLHIELFSKLQQRGLIKRFEFYKKHGDEIKVYALY